jgi:hypothetical protein
MIFSLSVAAYLSPKKSPSGGVLVRVIRQELPDLVAEREFILRGELPDGQSCEGLVDRSYVELRIDLIRDFPFPVGIAERFLENGRALLGDEDHAREIPGLRGAA